jgi:S-formylglutathione hydrolase FrmB
VIAAALVAVRHYSRGYTDARGFHVVHWTLRSRLLHRSLTEVAVLPPNRRARWMLVFLHGREDHPGIPLLRPESPPDTVLSDAFFAALARLGPRAPAVLALNGGGHSYFHDRRDGAWATSILREAIPAARARFHMRGPIAIGGISMGGYGALHLASIRPHEFCAIGRHSAALWTTPEASAPGAFDDAADWARNDVFAAARAGRFDRDTIWIDGGDRDPFHAADAAFVSALRARGVHVTYHVWPGGHDGAYWHAHLAQYFRFYAGACASA